MILDDDERREAENDWREEGWTYGLKYAKKRVSDLKRDMEVLQTVEGQQDCAWELGIWQGIVEEMEYLDRLERAEVKVVFTEEEAQALYGAAADVSRYTYSPALSRALISLRDAMDGTETRDRSNY